ncbi:MAG TPA: DUF4743 domain-containing protein, partial [Leucothrix mucor]|nr:DUF4743 domain-containing protein [Leucothrix mucor]
MSYLERIQACHGFDRSDYLDFVIADEVMGLTRPQFAEQLLRWEDVFQLNNNQLLLNPNLNNFEQRTQAVDPIMRQLHEEGVIPSWVE